MPGRCSKFLIVAAMLIALAPVGSAQSSTNYRMDRFTVASGADTAASGNFSLSVTRISEEDALQYSSTRLLTYSSIAT